MKSMERATMVEPPDTHDSAATKIVSVSYDKVFVPFQRANLWSAGKRPGTTRLLVQVRTADGTLGCGETICLHEFIEPVLARTIIPLSIGEDACDIERLMRKVEGAGYYHHKRAMVAARAGLESALWDIIGKQAGMPLHQLWGGAYRREVPTIAYVMAGTIEELVADAARYAEQGFGTIKLKIGMDERHDIESVREVRAAIGPDVRLRADVNGAWTIGTAKRQLKKLEAYDLEYIEQPLPLEDLRGHAALRRLTAIPIALDESAFTLQDVLEIIRHDAADVILLDAHEAGGWQQARKAAAVCEAVGLPVTLHCGGELGVSTAANLHLAMTLPNLLLAIDCQYHNQNGDVITEPFHYQRGTLRAPAGPGLGVALSEQQIARFRTDSIETPYLDPENPDKFAVKPQY